VRKNVLIGLWMCLAAACSSSSGPPDVASAPGGFGGSTPYVPCPAAAGVDSGSGTFNFEAGFDAGLGIGTTNPTTPSDGGSLFPDTGAAGGTDAGMPCH
jgi:hypothetical protein